VRRLGKLAAAALPDPGGVRFPARPCGYHALGGADGFAASDCVCALGARSPRSEGVYATAKIGVLLDGAFHAQSRHGDAVVSAGALSLGNAGAEYAYRHVDDGGDRSIVFDYDAALLDELGHGEFRRVCVPAAPSSAHAVMLTYEALCTGDREVLREAAFAVLAVAVAAQHDDVTPPAAAPAQSRRIAQALRYIEAHHAEDCSLATLAAHARLSSFYFLRTFRAVTGQTPRQVVIATRLRAAAALLRTTRRPIVEIALDAGFGDLSHFVLSFTRAFGKSPRAYRVVAR
jgi:AraC family transcriptional regulator